jgi:hypothetical protein
LGGHARQSGDGSRGAGRVSEAGFLKGAESAKTHTASANSRFALRQVRWQYERSPPPP